MDMTIVWNWIKRSIKTQHGCIVLLGLTIGLCYFPFWFLHLVQRALKGAASWYIIAGMLGFAAFELWQKRDLLAKLHAPEEDRVLGYFLILGGVLLFPFCRFALWSQAMIWLLILIGIACSTWGLRFFQKFTLPAVFIGLSVYPRLGNLSRGAWETVAPADALDRFMAWSGAAALNAIGREAVQQGVFIELPEGAVEVGWGCNGFDMAVTMAIAGLFMGLVNQYSRRQIVIMMAIAILIALVANIPRIMLVTIAHVYWGEAWFNFWHGFWGGQIFVSVLFTAYYYLVLALFKSNSPHSNSSSVKRI